VKIILFKPMCMPLVGHVLVPNSLSEVLLRQSILGQDYEIFPGMNGDMILYIVFYFFYFCSHMLMNCKISHMSAPLLSKSS
jgi:hypothetical protein